MLINYFLTGASSLAAAIPLIFILEKIFLKNKVLISRQGVPLIGGIGIALAFIIACAFGHYLFILPAKFIKGILTASFIMLAFGIFDDLRELSVATKFLVQIVATSILVMFGVKTQIMHIGPIANIFITFIWVLGITNALNHLDVIDGLAAGVALIVSLAFFSLSLPGAEIQIGIACLSLAAASLGFLLYNFPPAKVYMGNSGSHFLGFVLAAAALTISYAPAGKEPALFAPLLILGLPILDTGLLIVLRTMKKILPFQKSNDHLALRFLAMGCSKKKALVYMLGLCLFFACCGVILARLPLFFGLCAAAASVFIGLAVSLKMSKVSID